MIYNLIDYVSICTNIELFIPFYGIIYIFFFSIVIFHICMLLFESALLSFCIPQSKLDLPALRQGSGERKNASEQIKNSMYIYTHTHIYI